MCWFQGLDSQSLPCLNKLCLAAWKALNPGWNVTYITNDNIKEYVPEFFEIYKNDSKVPYVGQSDLLRILLLCKYGGVWVDASVYPVKPLDSYIDSIINETGFFTYRFFPRQSCGMGNRETVSWFLATSKPNHSLLCKWKTAFIKKFIKRSKRHWKRYTLHQTLCDIYDIDNNVRDTIDNMTQLSAADPLSIILNGYDNKTMSLMYKRPIHVDNILKIKKEFAHDF